jgi:hypothetical protein
LLRPSFLPCCVLVSFAETDHAYLVTSAITGKDAWVPKSQCEHEDGTLQIPEWLTVDKELV